MTGSALDWPLDTNRIRRGMINHTFGMVRRRSDGSRRPHQGWDFEAAIGTPCYAVAAGTVLGVVNRGAYGLQALVRFEHDFDDDGAVDTLFAFYAHLEKVEVSLGQSVSIGDRIGLTGNSGNARGMRGPDNHLHFEIRTRRWVGLGLAGRISPLALFGDCPLARPAFRRAVRSSHLLKQ